MLAEAGTAVALPARIRPRPPSTFSRAARQIRRDPTAVFAVIVLSTVLFAAVAGPLLVPHDPLDQNLVQRLRPPFWQDRGTITHPLGTDQLGRDILSRLIAGAQVSATVGLSVILLAGVLGSIVGLCAGFFGGRLDTVVVAIVDVVLSFPSLLLALTVVAVLGPNMLTLILALSFRGWVIYTRLMRGQTLSLSSSQFIEAARCIGASAPRIIARHLTPNLLPSLMTIAVLELARVVLAESSLSFLGLGIQPPEISWGLMLAQGRDYMLTANWLVTLPGVVIAMTVLSVNVLAAQVRRILDPYQRGRVEMEGR